MAWSNKYAFICFNNSMIEFASFCGRSDEAPAKAFFNWVDNDQLVESKYQNWINQKPEVDVSRDNCAVVSTTRSGWYSVSNCYVPLPYICEVNLNTEVQSQPSKSICLSTAIFHSFFDLALFSSRYVLWQRQ